MPTQSPSQAPTQSPTQEPSSSPTREPTGTPTTDPTTAPTNTPSARPTGVPTAYPSVGCSGLSNVLVTTRWLPNGASWGGITTTTYDSYGFQLDQTIGARADRTYECLDCNQGCTTVEYTFSPTAQATSSTLSYVVETPTEEISTSFSGGLAEESYFWCLANCRLARSPTAVPTVSAFPTPAPSEKPSIKPSEVPSPLPSVAPAPAPSAVPASACSSVFQKRVHGSDDRGLQVPTSAPTPRPSTQPTPRPTSLPTGRPTPRPTSARSRTEI